MRRVSNDVALRESSTSCQCFKLLGIQLLDHAEATELAHLAVEVCVVIGIACDEAVAADMIEGFNALDYLHRERQAGDPGSASELVPQIELGRGGIIDAGLGAKVVDHLDQQMRLVAAHQIDV